MTYRTTRLRVATTRRVRRTLERFDRRPVAHFLRIGKTAGSALRVALGEVRESTTYRVVPHPHRIHLDDVPDGEKFFFCVRDPVDRFVSGFFSRQREGRPRHVRPWRQDEERAFAQFGLPDDLGLALSAGGALQHEAELAMLSIAHVRTSYWDWFGDPATFRRRAADVLWIGHQESLDPSGLAHVLGVERLTMPDDPVVAHRRIGPPSVLSEAAGENLRAWYARDYAFLALLDEIFPSWSP